MKRLLILILFFCGDLFATEDIPIHPIMDYRELFSDSLIDELSRNLDILYQKSDISLTFISDKSTNGISAEQLLAEYTQEVKKRQKDNYIVTLFTPKGEIYIASRFSERLFTPLFLENVIDNGKREFEARGADKALFLLFINFADIIAQKRQLSLSELLQKNDEPRSITSAPLSFIIPLFLLGLLTLIISNKKDTKYCTTRFGGGVFLQSSRFGRSLK